MNLAATLSVTPLHIGLSSDLKFWAKRDLEGLEIKI